MRRRPSRGWGLLLLIAVTVAGLQPGSRARDEAADQITALVKQLDDRKFAKREEASKRLEALGEKALPRLRTILTTTRDLEVRRRVLGVVHAIMRSACKSKSLGLVLVVIEAGEFRMGSPNLELGRRPDELQHRVRITQPFVLGASEVTQDEFQQVLRTNPSWFTSKGDGKRKVAGLKTGRFPVENVTWYEAIEFCNRLSKHDGYPLYYKLTEVKREGDAITSASVSIAGGNGYRLPTEAEWEYACRADTNTRYHFGNDTRAGVTNCKPLLIASGYGSSLKWPDLGRTATVGSYPPNPWGLHDMHGNAGEWCWDWYDRAYYARSPLNDPRGPNRGDHRVLRGGSWLVSEGSCRSASRYFRLPNDRNYTGGFRVARTPSP